MYTHQTHIAQISELIGTLCLLERVFAPHPAETPEIAVAFRDSDGLDK